MGASEQPAAADDAIGMRQAVNGPLAEPVPGPQPGPDQTGDAEPRPEDDIEGTVMVRRTEFRPWLLSLDDGRRFDLMSRTVVIGRRPSAAEPGVQALAVADDTRTMSKTHARLDLVDGVWYVTDLGSTNGVMVPGQDGTEVEIEPGRSTACGGRVVLGAVGMTLAPRGDRL
jgi:hypothetical protein